MIMLGTYCFRYGATVENLCALCSFLVKSLEDEKVVVRVLQALVSVSKADMEELVIKALDGIGGMPSCISSVHVYIAKEAGIQ